MAACDAGRGASGLRAPNGNRQQSDVHLGDPDQRHAGRRRSGNHVDRRGLGPGGPLPNAQVSWSSSDNNVATVAAAGATASVTAVAPGSATITATTGTLSATAAIAVRAATQTLTITRLGAGQGTLTSTPAGLSCSGTSCTGSFATDAQVTLQPSPAGDSFLASWGGACSGNNACTLTMSEPRSASVTFDLKAVETVALTPPLVNLQPGETAQLATELRASDGTVLTGRTVTWSSNAANLVSVSNTGIVTAIAAGDTVTITATSEGKSGTSRVVVVAPSTGSPVVGNWVGSYVCLQGLQGLTVSIISNNAGAVTAQFTFYPLPANPSVPSGSFLMRGTLAGNTLNLDADESDWIVQPSGWGTVDLHGTISQGGNTWSGTTIGQACGDFTLTRSTATDGLVAYYPFTGHSRDLSGNSFNATPLGSVVLAPDRFGTPNAAYKFTAPSQISAPLYFASTALTVSAWIRLDSYRCWGGILDAYFDKWEFVMNCNGGNGLEFAEWRSPSELYDRVDTATLQLKRWYHVAVTIDGLHGQFYLDGAPTSSFTLSAPALTNPAVIALGHSASGTSQFLDGSLDEVRLYSRALTASEIGALCHLEAPSQHACAGMAGSR